MDLRAKAKGEHEKLLEASRWFVKRVQDPQRCCFRFLGSWY